MAGVAVLGAVLRGCGGALGNFLNRCHAHKLVNVSDESRAF